MINQTPAATAPTQISVMAENKDLPSLGHEITRGNEPFGTGPHFDQARDRERDQAQKNREKNSGQGALGKPKAAAPIEQGDPRDPKRCRKAHSEHHTQGNTSPERLAIHPHGGHAENRHWGQNPGQRPGPVGPGGQPHFGLGIVEPQQGVKKAEHARCRHDPLHPRRRPGKTAQHHERGDDIDPTDDNHHPADRNNKGQGKAAPDIRDDTPNSGQAIQSLDPCFSSGPG